MAGERTTLAWVRMGMTLLGVPAAVLVFARERSWLATFAAVLALGVGLVVLVAALRRQRAAAGMVERGGPHLAAEQVLLTVICVLLLCGAALMLVISHSAVAG